MMQVLLVDDSATARMFVRKCLEIAGCREAEFFEATNGQEALAFLRDHPVDLVVTDLTMPVMDGQTFLTHVMASPRLNGIPVVVVSSAGNPAKEKELLEIGAVGILRKPVSPAMLVDVIRPYLPPEGA
jgi:two-component system chemotaxis response regulator CheY